MSFNLIVVTPAGRPDPGMAIAAARAGGTGILNLEFAGANYFEQSLNAVALMSRSAGHNCAVMVDVRDTELLDAALRSHPQAFETVVLANSGGLNQGPAIASARKAGKQVWLVVTTLRQATEAERCGADALIAKGNEAGGWVGEETSFVLLQHLLPATKLPVHVQGGIGLHTAAACYAAGASGVVLDSQLLLTKESPLGGPNRERVMSMDGSETQLVGASLGASFRAYARGDSAMTDILAQMETAEAIAHKDAEEARASWQSTISRSVDWAREGAVWPVGQDAALAREMAGRFATVGGVLSAVRESVAEHCRMAAEQDSLAAHAPLAAAHGTRFPIVQGPMTRVSDRAAFAAGVAEAGALPFLALALMKAKDIRPILRETREKVGSLPWGVGILGFVPPDLRAEQLEVVREARPPFALIAGGQPSQAKSLEADGIQTYLHVPSPGLLEIYLREGVRKFVFEGRECGGHVGPRTSFILWESMIDVLLEFTAKHAVARECQILFAGGIHDGLSAQMVSAMAAPLVARGAKVGVLLGTAYLFTEEAVGSGAIQPEFQKAAVDCKETVVLAATPGYATRCLPSPFCETFEQERRRLILQGTPLEEMKQGLEELNIGRLRIASKGVDRNPLYGTEENAPRLIEVDQDEQWQRGMYMIGQVATLRDRTVTLNQLHEEVSKGSSDRWAALSVDTEELPEHPPRPAIAIVGMSSILPGSTNLGTFWRNILNKVDSVTEVPPERWDPAEYFDPDPEARDKVYSRWGGFIDEVPFEPLDWGMPPSSLPSIEPFQLLALEMVRSAVEDAGYGNRPFSRERTSVILGAGGGAPDLTAGYVVRSSLPGLFGFDTAAELTDRLDGVLPTWTEDTFPGLLMNVAAGRVANRFDFGGINYTVDAACASSLAAVYLGVRDLQAGTSDVVIVGGAEGIQNPFDFLCFAKTHALSPTGRSRPFDEEADGIAISEGFACLFLKRLEDAERDGDRIYAVIRGAGASSDGRDKGLTAPRPEGQMRAFRRAYRDAGFSPATVGLFEAHGTGTVAGDKAEIQSLTTLLTEAGAAPGIAAVGSVKSMIGHTKAAAGVASMVKTAKALHHKVLPPTLGVIRPNSRLKQSDCPLYVNTEPRPWVHGPSEPPRRAGVSAFGFGGTNFHIALEEYTGGYLPQQDLALDEWPDEVFVLQAPTTGGLLAEVGGLIDRLVASLDVRPADLAYTLSISALKQPPGPRLAVVAGSIELLIERLTEARNLIESGSTRVHQPSGIHFRQDHSPGAASLAFLFPGQGSQAVNMALDLALVFPEVRSVLDRADRYLGDRLPKPLSRFIYPPPAFSKEEAQNREAELTATNIAQPALGAVEAALVNWLSSLGLTPAMTAGHSYGEFAALHAAGSLSFESLLELSEARGRFMAEAAEGTSGGMAAVMAPEESLAPLLKAFPLTLANLNSPLQTVVSGPTETIDAAVEWCAENGLRARRLPVASAFHSPLVAGAQERLAEVLADTTLSPATLPVFSNTTGGPYPEDAGAAAQLLAGQLARPVRFVDEIEAMYERGARLFLEVGPRNVLTGLVRKILGDREHLAIPLELPGRGGLTGALNALAALFVEGVEIDAERLFRDRPVRKLDLGHLDRAGRPAPSPTAWMVSGAGARPAHVPKDKPALPIKIAAAANTADRSAPQAGSVVGSAPAIRSVPAPVAQPVSPDLIDRFQQVMQRFLAVQESVMMAALSQPQAPEPAPAPALAEAPGDVSPPQPLADSEARTAGPVAVDHDLIIATLLSIVSERTGYPAESLGLNSELEADLGIDSIKRVEIAGTVGREMAGLLGGSVELESLTACRTLAEMAVVLIDFSQRPNTAEDPPTPTPVPEIESEQTAPSGDHRLERFGLRTVPTPTPHASGDLNRAGVVVILDDGIGAAESLEALLEQDGRRTLRLTPNAGGVPATAEFAARVLKDAHRRGPVAALIDLSAVGTGPAPVFEPEALFYLTQAFQTDLIDSAGRGGAAVLGALNLGGEFGRTPAPGNPHQAWRAGFLKSLAREWDGVRVKVVDLGVTQPAAIAGMVRDELLAEDDDVEIGYGADGLRRACRLARLAPPRGALTLPLDQESVVLVTGGARGITAEAARELAVATGCRLVLVGRTPAPGLPESPATAELTDERDLKRALFEELLAGGESPVPALIQSRFQALTRAREVREHLRRFTEAGVEFTYISADVSDSAAFSTLIENLYRQYGRIDGAIHGAGIIEDRLIADKDLDSFRRVFETKVAGASVLAGSLQPDSLKFLVFYSSVAGRFGNRGQADYAAANEVLNKLAQELDRSWPGRVVAINWGPWSTTGMVTDEAERQFASLGVGQIPVDAGCRMMLEELSAGIQGEPEVIIAKLGPAAERYLLPASPDEIRRLSEMQISEPGNQGSVAVAPPALALLRNALIEPAVGGVDISLNFDVARDIYLADHVLDDKPVVPFAMGLELMAEAAMAGWRDSYIQEVRDIRMLNGIVIDGPRMTVSVRAREEAEAPDGSRLIQVSVISEADGRIHYRSTVQLGPRQLLSAAPLLLNGHFGPLEGAEPPEWGIERLYEEWLFHGPIFAAIQGIERMGPLGATGRLRISLPQECLADSDARSWITDPILIDAAFQMQVLWARKHWDMTILPSSVASWRPAPGLDLREFESTGVICELRIRPETAAPISHTDFAFYAPDGRLLGLVSDLAATGSYALNRLSTRKTGGNTFTGAGDLLQ